MKTRTFFNKLLLLILVFNSTLAFATRDLLETFTSNITLQCSPTGYLEVFADLDEDGTDDTKVRIIATIGGVAKEDFPTVNENITLYTGNAGGSCTSAGAGQFTIRILDMANNPKPIAFVSLITDATNTVSAQPFIIGGVVLSDEVNYGTHIRHTFRGGTSSNIGDITITLQDDVSDSFLDELIISNIKTPGLVHLFDLSGSMNIDTDGDPATTGDTRIELAKTSVLAFNDLLEALTAAEELYDKFEYGIAGFPNLDTEPIFDCDGQIIEDLKLIEEYDEDAVPDNPIDELDAIITGLTASGNTPVFGGIDVAQTMLAQRPYKNIVLLSDGYHNCPGVLTPASYEVGGQMYNLIEELKEQHITVHTIGIGGPGDPDIIFLSALASGTGGYFYDVTSSTDVTASALNKTYDDIFKNTMGLFHAYDPIETIKKGETKTIPVNISHADQFVSFYISHSTPVENYLNVSIVTSNNRPLPETNRFIKKTKTKNYTIISIYPPFLLKRGIVSENPWKLVVNGKNLKSDSETFHYSVLCKSGLKLFSEFEMDDYYTGDTLKLFLTLTEKDKIIRNIKDIQVKLTRPSEGIGNWLASNKVTRQQLLNARKKTVDSLNNIQLKARILSETNIQYPEPIWDKTIRFSDNGTNGDKQANDGIYTAMYTNLDKEGTYKFHISVLGYTKKNELFTRETEIQKYVNVKLTPASINTRVLKEKPDFSFDLKNKPNLRDRSIYSVNLTVKDKYGNIPHPAALRSINLSANNAKLVSGIQVRPDGRFVQYISPDPGTRDGDIKLNIKIGDETAEKAVKIEDSKPKLWKFLLVIILVIILVIYRANKKKNQP